MDKEKLININRIFKDTQGYRHGVYDHKRKMLILLMKMPIFRGSRSLTITNIRTFKSVRKIDVSDQASRFFYSEDIATCIIIENSALTQIRCFPSLLVLTLSRKPSNLIKVGSFVKNTTNLFICATSRGSFLVYNLKSNAFVEEIQPKCTEKILQIQSCVLGKQNEPAKFFLVLYKTSIRIFNLDDRVCIFVQKIDYSSAGLRVFEDFNIFGVVHSSQKKAVDSDSSSDEEDVAVTGNLSITLYKLVSQELRLIKQISTATECLDFIFYNATHGYLTVIDFQHKVLSYSLFNGNILYERKLPKNFSWFVSGNQLPSVVNWKSVYSKSSNHNFFAVFQNKILFLELTYPHPSF